MVDLEQVKVTTPDFERRAAKYPPIAAALREVYGPLNWDYGEDPVDELISCVLSQNTSDTNRDRGFYSLKSRFPTWREVMEAAPEEVVDAIRVAGLSKQKGPRIQRILRRILDERGAFDLDFLRDMPNIEARAWLTSLDGVGPKTAAIVMCFAFGLPAFPVDTHIHRVGMRTGMLPPKISADKAHDVMEAIVPVEAHYEFHIHVIRHGRTTCKARRPLCEKCPITTYCDYYQQVVLEGGSPEAYASDAGEETETTSDSSLD
jgi:endonuclease-3